MTEEVLEESKSKGVYFDEERKIHTFSTGCQLLDSALGGGYAENRIINIVGSSGSAKTGMAIEACANFYNKYPYGHMWYAETESAFDVSYAEVLGMPTESIEFPEEIFSVEDVFEHIDKVVLESQKTGVPGLYIIDSLDALSDRAELGRGIDENSYGANKAKKLSELFRRLTQKLEDSNVTVIVISQIRDNMNATPFSSNKTRSGGKALEFYCTQIMWVDRTEKLQKTVRGEKRPIGAKIKVDISKNKIGPPFRQAIMYLYFNYGIDDLESNVNWLSSINRLKDVDSEVGGPKDFLKKVDKLSDEEFHEIRQQVDQAVDKNWKEIESEIAPRRKKY